MIRYDMWFVFICVCNTVGLARINTGFVLLGTDCKHCEVWFFCRESVVVFSSWVGGANFLACGWDLGRVTECRKAPLDRKRMIWLQKWYVRRCEDGIFSESSPIAVLNPRILLPAPAALYPRERPGTHCTGGWVGLRAGLDRCGKSRPHRDSIPGPSSP